MPPTQAPSDTPKLVQPTDIFQKIQTAASEGYQGLFPIIGKSHELRAHKVWVEDDKDPHDYKDQEQTKLSGNTWGVPVYADLELVDNSTGTTLHRHQKVRDRKSVV